MGKRSPVLVGLDGHRQVVPLNKSRRAPQRSCPAFGDVLEVPICLPKADY